MKYFQKTSTNVGKYFQKGHGGRVLFRKAANTLTQVSPLISLVNPSLGAISNVAGHYGSSLAR